MVSSHCLAVIPMGEWLVYSIYSNMINSDIVTSQSVTEESAIHENYFDFSGNNTRIIGCCSGMIGQFCGNRGIEHF